MKILFDLGANVGQSIVVFSQTLERFEDYIVYAFEPNKSLIPKIQLTIDDLKTKPAKIEVYNKAASDRDGETVIWMNDNASIASTIIAEKGKSRYCGISVPGNTREALVETVDFGKFFGSIVTQKDYVILKIDIEGAEYPVLESLLAAKQFANVDKLLVEWHERFMPKNYRPKDEILRDIKNSNPEIEIDNSWGFQKLMSSK